MKVGLALGLTGVFAVVAGTLMAQDRPTEVSALRAEVAADIRQAASRAGVEGSDLLVIPFVDSAVSQKETFAQVYSTVARDVRVNRLARYLSAKAAAKSSPPSARVSGDDLADFHWGYVARDIEFSSVRLDSPKPAKLVSVESPDGRYAFAAVKPTEFKPGSKILLPVSAGQSGENLTLTFALGDAQALWTGSPKAGPLSLTAAATSKGCEVLVNSKPDKASIYFNGKEWHELTNTAVVHDPGTWEVIVRLKGYKEWRAQRGLRAGESWTINALLTKQ